MTGNLLFSTTSIDFVLNIFYNYLIIKNKNEKSRIL